MGENEDAKAILMISRFCSTFFYIETKIGHQIEKYSIFFKRELGRKMDKTAKKETVFVAGSASAAQRVDELRSSGKDSTLAEEVLATFQKSLNLFENRLQTLLGETSN